MMDGANFISNDDFCEKHNNKAKQCPPQTNFDKMCANSKHLQGSMRAVKEFLGDNRKQHTFRSNMQDQIDSVCSYFKTVSVFESTETRSVVDDNTFWKFVVPQKVVHWRREKRTKENQFVAETDHERKALEMLMDKSMIEWRDGVEETSHNTPGPVSGGVTDAASVCDDLSYRSAGSSDGSAVDKRDHVEFEERNDVADLMAIGMDDMMVLIAPDGEDRLPNASCDQPLTTVEAQEITLKKLGNVQRYKMNPACKDDVFKSGREKLLSVVQDCEHEMEKMRKTHALIYDSVRFFLRSPKE